MGKDKIIGDIICKHCVFRPAQLTKNFCKPFRPGIDGDGSYDPKNVRQQCYEYHLKKYEEIESTISEEELE